MQTVLLYLVLVLLHHGELSLQLPQHLKLRGLQAGPVTPQLFQSLDDGQQIKSLHKKKAFGHKVK